MLLCLLIAINLAIPDMLSGKCDYACGTLTGVVQDVLDDETDPRYLFLVVSQGQRAILASVKCESGERRATQDLIGATVRLHGFCDPFVLHRERQHMGRRFTVNSPTNIAVITPPVDMFKAPNVQQLDSFQPDEFPKLPRHRVEGRVLATWDNDKVLVLTSSNALMRIDLADPNLPRFGSFIEAVGFPETDLYHINLSRAHWRSTKAESMPQERVIDSSISDLMTKFGLPAFEKTLFGETLRVKGRIKDAPHAGVLLLEDNGQTLLVDITQLGENTVKDLSVGMTVEMIGSFIMDVDNWRPHAQFPKVHNVILVTRTPADIRILAYPPWWTVGKLVIVIVGLLAALLGITIWNRVLRKIVERRGRELFKEQVAHVSANLRTEERTRLAIELHDSISQNLTGVTLEIKAAQATAGEDLETALSHLDIAERSLTSCHTELRNCLWDLRHGTLESMDMNEAIRQTLLPHVGDIDLAVRFEVPRRRLTDNTAYAILKIIRELAVNAVHHGKATSIKIAGAIDREQIRFSVTDNGCGFDPKTVPGPEQGHFGLLGVTERINAFGGEIEIESSPSKGTRVIIAITASPSKEDKLI